MAPHSLAFAPDGSQLLGGFDGAVRLFPTHRPGRHSQERRLHREGRGLRGRGLRGRGGGLPQGLS